MSPVKTQRWASVMTNEANTMDAGTAAEPFIKKAEVARRLGKTVRTIDTYMSKGCVPFYRLNGRSVVFKWSEVVAYLGETCRVCRRISLPGARVPYRTVTMTSDATPAQS